MYVLLIISHFCNDISVVQVQVVQILYYVHLRRTGALEVTTLAFVARVIYLLEVHVAFYGLYGLLWPSQSTQSRIRSIFTSQRFQTEGFVVLAEPPAVPDVVVEVPDAAGGPPVGEVARAVALLVVHVAVALLAVHRLGLARAAHAPAPALGGVVGALVVAALVVVAHAEVVPDLVGNGLKHNIRNT